MKSNIYGAIKGVEYGLTQPKLKMQCNFDSDKFLIKLFGRLKRFSNFNIRKIK